MTRHQLLGRQMDDSDGWASKIVHAFFAFFLLTFGLSMLVLFTVLPTVDVLRHPAASSSHLILMVGMVTLLTPPGALLVRAGWIVGGRAFDRRIEPIVPTWFATTMSFLVAIPTTLMLLAGAVADPSAALAFFRNSPFLGPAALIALYGTLAAGPSLIASPPASDG